MFNTKLKELKGQHGFTLLEVLLVVAVIAILAGIVIIAINPGKQLSDTRDAQRQADVTTILSAVYQYALDNDGALPADIPVSPASALEICATGVAVCGATLADISEVTTNEEYITSVPEDPQCATVCATDGVGYTIVQSANGRITVAAPDAENTTISVTR